MAQAVSQAEIVRQQAIADRDKSSKPQLKSIVVRLAITKFLTSGKGFEDVPDALSAGRTTSSIKQRIRKVILEDNLSGLVWFTENENGVVQFVNVAPAVEENEDNEDENEDTA